MGKTANLNARIEPEVKRQAEEILSALGIPVSNAINMFYKQIILQRGIPFDLKLPPEELLVIEALTEAQMDVELQKGYDDAVAERSKPYNTVFESIRNEYHE